SLGRDTPRGAAGAIPRSRVRRGSTRALYAPSRSVAAAEPVRRPDRSARPRARVRRGRPNRFAAVRPRECRRLCAPPARHRAGDAAPRRFRLNGEVIVCGHSPALEVAVGSATTIATGGVIPRGADAVAMIEHTDLVDDGGAPAIDLRRAVAPGQSISYAGSD